MGLNSSRTTAFKLYVILFNSEFYNRLLTTVKKRLSLRNEGITTCNYRNVHIECRKVETAKIREYILFRIRPIKTNIRDEVTVKARSETRMKIN